MGVRAHKRVMPGLVRRLEVSALVEAVFGFLARIPGNNARSLANQMKAGSKYSARVPEETVCSRGSVLRAIGPEPAVQYPFWPPARDDES